MEVFGKQLEADSYGLQFSKFDWVVAKVEAGAYWVTFSWECQEASTAGMSLGLTVDGATIRVGNNG